MATRMETILSNLLVPDRAVIQQATQQLRRVCRDPGIILQLYPVLTSAQDPQVRQYGAFIIRRRITRKKQWTNLRDESKQHLRSNIIHAVIQENEKSVRDALVQIVATIAKHELSGGWPELFAFLDEFTKSPDATKRELGLHVLSQVTDVASQHLKRHLLGFSRLFEQAFMDHENRMCQFYAVLTMSHLFWQMRTDEQSRFQLLIMPLLQAIRGLISKDEEKACKALGIFDKLMYTDVAVIVLHMKRFVEFCLEIAANQSLGNEIRVKVMSFINLLTELECNSILEHELVEPVLEVMFTIMCVTHGEEDDESSDPCCCASRIVATMAVYFSPRIIMPKMMSLIQRALRSSDPHHKKAGYLALHAVVCGWLEIIRDEYLDACVQWLTSGVQDPSPIVRNSAILALARFSGILQPDISKFADKLIPSLLNYLRASHTANDTDSSLSKTYCALGSFFKYMRRKILPHLAPLMEHLLSGLSENNSLKIRELSIDAISSIVSVAKQDLAPYFQSIIEHSKPFLNANCTEELLVLQIKFFDAIYTLYVVLGKKQLLPFADEYIKLGIQVMTATKNPNLKRRVYKVMTEISRQLKHNMDEFLQPIVDQIVKSFKSDEDVTVHCNEEQEDVLKLFDVQDVGTDDTESDDEEDYEIQNYSFEDNYVKEKHAACIYLREIVSKCGQAFVPHIERVYEEMVKLFDHPASKVRKECGIACVDLCIFLAKSVSNGNHDAAFLLSSVIYHLLPRLLACIREDDDKSVVIMTLLAVAVLLFKVQGPVLADWEHFPAIRDCIRCVLSKETACQDEDYDTESEYGRLLIEQAVDIIPAFIKAQNGENSIFLVTAFLPDIVKRLEHRSIRDRIFAIETVARILNALGKQSEVFAEELYPVIMHTVRDVSDAVRSSAIFAVGVLVNNGGQKIITKYDEILNVLMTILAREHDNSCFDDICGTVCQMLLKCPQSLPVDQIVPVVLRNLPLRKYFYKYSTIFECLNSLYAAEQKDVVQNLSRILSMIARVLTDDQYTDDCKDHMLRLVKRAAENRPEVVTYMLATLNRKQKQMLEECLSLEHLLPKLNAS